MAVSSTEDGPKERQSRRQKTKNGTAVAKISSEIKEDHDHVKGRSHESGFFMRKVKLIEWNARIVRAQSFVGVVCVLNE